MSTVPEVDFGKLVRLDPSVTPDKVGDYSTRLAEKYVGHAAAQTAAKRIIERCLSPIKVRKDVRGFYLFAGAESIGKKSLGDQIVTVLFGSPENRVMVNCGELSHTNDYGTIAMFDEILLNSGMMEMTGGGPTRTRNQPKLSSARIKSVRGASPLDAAIVILDNFQLAPDRLINYLERILYDGVLEEGGKKHDYRDVVFILIYNTDDASGEMGLSRDTQCAGEITAESIRTKLQQEHGESFAKAFDEIVLFGDFTEDDLERMLDLAIEAIEAEVTAKGQGHVFVHPPARQFLLAKIKEANCRGSDVAGTVKRYISQPLAREVLKRKSVFHVTHEGGDVLSFYRTDEEVEAVPATGHPALTTSGGTTTGDGTSDAASAQAQPQSPPKRMKYAFRYANFTSKAEADTEMQRIIGLIKGLPAPHTGVVLKAFVKDVLGVFMMRIEFISTQEGLQKIASELGIEGMEVEFHGPAKE